MSVAFIVFAGLTSMYKTKDCRTERQKIDAETKAWIQEQISP